MVANTYTSPDALDMAAELLGLAEDIFTVKTYTNVPVRDFIAVNDEIPDDLNVLSIDGNPGEEPPDEQPKLRF